MTKGEKLGNEIEIAKKYSSQTYFGAWLVFDNKHAVINKSEIERFAEHFVSTLAKAGIPWSLNTSKHSTTPKTFNVDH